MSTDSGPDSTVEFPLTAGIVDSEVGNDFTLDVVPTRVATAELLEVLGLDGADLEGHDVVTNREGRFAIVNDGGLEPGLDDDLAVSVVDFARYSQTPGALLSQRYVGDEVFPRRRPAGCWYGAAISQPRSSPS